MLDEAESEAAEIGKPSCKNQLLLQKFKNCYQDITVGRPERFYDTVCRIAAPTKQSLRGTIKLTGSPLATYKQRVWLPKVRNKRGMYNYNNLIIAYISFVSDLNMYMAPE